MSKMVNVEVTDKSTALDLIFGFLQLAQRRGAFSLQESSKIFQCIEQFNDFFQKDEHGPDDQEYDPEDPDHPEYQQEYDPNQDPNQDPNPTHEETEQPDENKEPDEK